MCVCVCVCDVCLCQLSPINLNNPLFSDVVPFLEAVENMCTYYETRGVDIFKEAVSGNFKPQYLPLNS